MSLILDALRKSDRERARQASERLRMGPGAAGAPTLPRWILGMLAGAILLLALVLLLLLPGREVASRTATGASGEIMENERVAATVRSLRGELARPTPEPAGAPPPATARPAPTTPPDPAPGPSLEDLNATPYASLPPEIRNRWPALHVDIHAWSETPAERFVLINLRRYGEGEQLEEGPVLRRILPDGVVLDADGLLFSLPRH